VIILKLLLNSVTDYKSFVFEKDEMVAKRFQLCLEFFLPFMTKIFAILSLKKQRGRFDTTEGSLPYFPFLMLNRIMKKLGFLTSLGSRGKTGSIGDPGNFALINSNFGGIIVS